MDITNAGITTTSLCMKASETSTSINDKNVQMTHTLQRTRHRIIEDFITVWLDPTIDESNSDYKSAIAQLRCIKIFNNDEECIKFIHNFKDHKVFLILSGAFDEMLISLVHDLSQLDSIYIFSSKMTGDEQLLKERKKVRDVFTDISLICAQIKQSTRKCEHNWTSISIIPASHAVDLNELDSSFMYSHLLKDILLGMQYDEKAKREFVNFLGNECVDNHIPWNLIDEFERDYETRSPIWWYTKESFIYSVLNTALRTQDIDIIIKMGFYIRDLDRQIEQVYLAAHQQTRMTVYRGQGMTETEFEKIKQHQDSLLSFNNFLSTSTDQQVAFIFADSARNDPDLTGILFQIEIDSSISSFPFVSVNDISYYSSEKEILFSMHTVFRIGNMQKLDDRLWQVNLTLTNDNDEQLKRVTDYIRKEIEGGSQNHLLGRLMIKMGKFDQAEEVFKALIESTSEDDMREMADLNCHLGSIKHLQGDAISALSYYEKTREIREKTLSSTDPDLAKIYSNMGGLYYTRGQYPLALSYHEKALQIREKILPSTDPDLAKTYNNVGGMNHMMGNYPIALSYYEKTLAIKQKSLPPTHPALATTYNNIALLHKSKGDYSNALSNYEKALIIEQKSLPSTHSTLATTYNNIAGLNKAMGDYPTALSYMLKTLEIQEKTLSPTHPDLATTYNNIGNVHILMGNYPIALFHLERTLEIQLKQLSPIHPSLAKTYINMGETHDFMGEYSTALSYYEKTLKIQQESLGSFHPDLAITYNKMGNVLNKLGHYKDALMHAERAVDIACQTAGSDHSDLKRFQDDMEQIRQKL